MKRTFLLLALLLPLIQLSAQQTIDWKKTDHNSESSTYNEFYRFKNNKNEKILLSPNKINAPDYALQGINPINNNNPKKHTETHRSSDSPNEAKIKVINKDNGLATINHDAENQNNVSEKQSTSFVMGYSHNYSGIPTYTQSFDSNYLIVSDYNVTPALNSGGQKRVIHYVSVYDKNLDVVWNDSIDFSEVLEQNKVIDGSYFEFINGKFYVIGFINGVPLKTFKPEILVLQFEKPHSGKLILDQAFKHNSIGWKYIFTNDDHLILCGINIAYSSPYVNGFLSSVFVRSNPAKTLFFTKLNVKASDEPILFKEWEVDNDFAKKYPDYKSILDVFLSFPSDVWLVKDGIVFCSEYVEEVTETGKIMSVTDHYRAITLIKFNFNGEINWIKMVNKHIGTENLISRYFCRSFVSKDNIVVFYYDVAKNIFSNTLKTQTFTLDSKVCLATLIVDPEGNIKKSLIYKIGDTHMYTDLSRMIQIDYNRFFLKGQGITRKNEGNYNSNFTLQE